MRRLRWLIAILLAFAMIAAACGDDDSDTAEEPADDTAEEPADDTAEEPADDTAEEPADDTAEEPADDTGDDAPAEIATDVGVDDTTIRIGMLVDLTGAFAPLTVPIADGAEAYWEMINERGGVAGRQVELVTLDTGYDVPTHQQHYDTLSSTGSEGVVMIGNTTGSPHTASIRQDLVDDGMAAVVLSWNSSWPDPASSNVFEWLANYCVEAMNGITYMSEQYGSNVAVVSWPGDYGEDGAIGAKYAIEQLGLNLVYDGQGAQAPTAPPEAVIAGIVEASPDFVWITTNPTDAAAIIGGAAAAGYTGQWAGNAPSYNPALLGVEGVNAILDASYTHFQTYPTWGLGGSAAMDEIQSMMRERRPDAALLSVYVISWIMGEIARQGLETAAANGDMTRQGVVDALTATTVGFQGLVPDISYEAEPNEIITRESVVLDIVLDDYTPGATVSDEDAGEGFTILEEGYVSPTAAEWEYEACFPI